MRCWLDIGAADAEEAARSVQLGDTAVLCAIPQKAGEFLLSPYLSDRAACLALMEVLASDSEPACDLTVVFAAQGSLGDRGIRAAVFAGQPDLCVCVETVPDKTGSIVCGGGPVLKIMDDAVICHTEVIRALAKAAEASGVPYTRLVSSGTRSTGGQVQPLYGGVLTGGIAIPCRYRGTAGEMVHIRDIHMAAQWLSAFLSMDLSGLKGDSYGFEHQ